MPTNGKRSTKRWMLSLGSLRVQLAVGSALVALGAIALVTLLAVMGANLTIFTSQRAAITMEAARAAQALAQGNTVFTASPPLLSGAAPPAGQAGATLTLSTLGPYLVWVMDRDGHVAVQTAIPGATSSAQDETTIRAALLAALSGQEREDILPSSAPWLSALFLSHPPRWYLPL